MTRSPWYFLTVFVGLTLGSAIRSNDSYAVATNQTEGLGQPPGWVAIPPFQRNGYSYAGASWGETEIKAGFELGRFINYNLVQIKPRNVRTRAGDEYSKVIYTPYDAAFKYRLQWIMEGGPALTYGECIDVLNGLAMYLDGGEGESFDNQDFSITITKDGLTKIIVTASFLEFETLEIEGSQALRLHVDYYPDLPLPKSNILSVMNSALKYYEDHVQNDAPPAWLGNHEDHTWRRGDVRLEIWFNLENGPPGLRYGDVVDIIRQLIQETTQIDTWTAIYSNFELKGPQGPENEVGHLIMQSVQLSALSPGNGTEASEKVNVSEVTTS